MANLMFPGIDAMTDDELWREFDMLLFIVMHFHDGGTWTECESCWNQLEGLLDKRAQQIGMEFYRRYQESAPERLQ